MIIVIINQEFSNSCNFFPANFFDNLEFKQLVQPFWILSKHLNSNHYEIITNENRGKKK